MSDIPSIFNDVLGPVMRGPSSSHSAAALRIGRFALDLMGGELTHVRVDYDPSGSLVTTHDCQGSDLGLFGGLMGWETDDERLPNFRDEIKKAGIEVEICYTSYGAEHPNTYRLTMRNATRERSLEAISTGGGMIVIQNIDGFPVELKGDYHETVIIVSGDDTANVVARLQAEAELEDIIVSNQPERSLVIARGRSPLPDSLVATLGRLPGIVSVDPVAAVLPVLGRKDLSVPFLSCEEMLAYREQEGGTLSLAELATRYEAARGGITEAEVREKMGRLVDVFESSITTGLGGTSYEDRLLHYQSGGFSEKLSRGALIPSDALNRVILYVTAMMEMKSSMGVIVAAPTAGSCGALPGAVFGVCDAMGLDREHRIDALMVAGLIGVFITARSTFAAEVAGCMAECGSGSSMSAAALTGLAGGSFEQQLGAASQALQNSFGMTCDTLANRVEAPCLGKNVMAASNALACANMALADYQHLIPLDQVIDAMREVGDLMPREICCTGLGGLAVTPTSRDLEKMLEDKKAASSCDSGSCQCQPDPTEKEAATPV
ncbi:MAG: L-serine ammonia-lyase, iron-sulfur-dependent, subunit alpha [Verrucomicrobiota bacterium JB023]|nr:L-serine ammonia-lyase, iron-sulfur-dependent, subunit alpha [Verrucomicrobiota bacterium JB023]